MRLSGKQVNRLDRIRDLLVQRDPRAARQTKLLLFTGNDFTPELLAVADSVTMWNWSTLSGCIGATGFRSTADSH
jgi:hypothetical protein